MNVVGAPRRVVFTFPTADLVGSSAVYLSVQPPTGAAFDRLAVLDSSTGGLDTYHADITIAETTAGGAGLWRVMPKIVGVDPAAFPKFDDAVVLDFELQWSTPFAVTHLLSPTELREHITTSLSDAALARILDAEEAEIVERWGEAQAAQVEEFEAEFPGALIIPKRKVLSITSIVETWVNTFIGGAAPTTLAASDYEIVPGGKQIRRLSTGAHPLSSWGTRVTLTYVPADETSKRILALVNLCKLALAFNGLDSESVGGGEYRMDQGDYDAKREKILAGIGSAQRNYA